MTNKKVHSTSNRQGATTTCLQQERKAKMHVIIVTLAAALLTINYTTNSINSLLSDFVEFNHMANPMDYNSKLRDRLADISLSSVSSITKQCNVFKERAAMMEEKGLELLKLRRTAEDCTVKGKIAQLAQIDFVCGLQNTLQCLFNTMSRGKSSNDYQVLLRRLQAVPTLLDQTVELLKDGVTKNITLAKESLWGVKEQFERLVQLQDTEQSDFYSLFKSIPMQQQGSRLLKSRARLAIELGIIPAFERLKRFVFEEYVNHLRSSAGLSSVPGGSDYYRSIIDTNPDLAHYQGVRGVTEVREKMEAYLKVIGMNATVKQFLKSHGSKLRSIEPENNVNWKSKLARFFDQEFIHSLLNWEKRGNDNCISNVHEQLVMVTVNAMMVRNDVYYCNTAVDTILSSTHFFSAMSGWGFYVDSLGLEMRSFSENPKNLLAFYSRSLLREAMLVVDTGIHALEWSRQRAVTYLTEEAGVMEDAELEVARCVARPGMAAGATIVHRHLMELRREGNGEVKQFHRDGMECLLLLGPSFGECLNYKMAAGAASMLTMTTHLIWLTIFAMAQG